MTKFNVYQDPRRAAAYDSLEFGGTYHLAFRDLPDIIRERVRGPRALDFGCGAGRSTRFLEKLGFRTVGVDIAPEMLEKARARDPKGDYRLVEEGGLGPLESASFDLILSAFTFDNIPNRETKVRLFREFRRVLASGGCLINVVSAPELYSHEWASFSTKDFPENAQAKPGEVVRIITTDFEDRRPCLDILFPDESYRRLYAETGFEVGDVLKPLAKGNEPFAWVSETRVAPWTIYVLRGSAESAKP